MGQALRLTYDDYALMPEGIRYELIEGDLLMTPSPNTLHQRVIRELFDIIESYVQEKGLGEVFFAPYDVILSNNNVVQPDILFISKVRIKIVSDRGLEGAPDLVVEILSPATRDRDLKSKRALYAKYAVREYWIVDPGDKTIEVCVHKDGELATRGVHREGSRVKSSLFAKLSFDPASIFSD
jgi:Uma2 family endonuclease